MATTKATTKPAKSILPAQQFLRTCREHPAEVNETYFQHMRFAMRMAFRLLKAASAALLHSLVPALCETTASREVCAMHDEITRRHFIQSSDAGQR